LGPLFKKKKKKFLIKKKFNITAFKQEQLEKNNYFMLNYCSIFNNNNYFLIFEKNIEVKNYDSINFFNAYNFYFNINWEQKISLNLTLLSSIKSKLHSSNKNYKEILDNFFNKYNSNNFLKLNIKKKETKTKQKLLAVVRNFLFKNDSFNRVLVHSLNFTYFKNFLILFFNFIFLKYFYLFFKFIAFKLKKTKFFKLKKKKKIKINFIFFLKKKLFIKKVISFKKTNIFFFEKKQGIYFKYIYKKIKHFYKKKNSLKIKKKFFKQSLIKKLQLFKSKNIKLVLKKKTSNKFTKSFSAKKYFKLKKKDNLIFLKNFFFYYKLKTCKVSSFLKSFKNKTFFEISYLFKRSLINCLSFFFFFLNKYYIKFLLKKNFIFINFKPNIEINSYLKLGDFVQIVHFKQIIKLLKYWSKRQKKYFKIIKKKLNSYKKSKHKKLIRNISSNFPKAFFFFINTKKFIPKYFEFDYLTLSFFFLNRKTFSYYQFINFNPFLFRLLQYK
jgi:hypothetical protein